jgi:hypothetical protein
MRVIHSHEAVMRPQRCAVVPYLGPTSGHRFIDTGQDMDEWHRVYVSEPAFVEMARLFGTYVPAGEHRQVVVERDRLRAELDQERAEVQRLQKFKDSIDTFESEGFRARKKAGRPAGKAEVG